MTSDLVWLATWMSAGSATSLSDRNSDTTTGGEPLAMSVPPALVIFTFAVPLALLVPRMIGVVGNLAVTTGTRSGSLAEPTVNGMLPADPTNELPDVSLIAPEGTSTVIVPLLAADSGLVNVS